MIPSGNAPRVAADLRSVPRVLRNLIGPLLPASSWLPQGRGLRTVLSDGSHRLLREALWGRGARAAHSPHVECTAQGFRAFRLVPSPPSSILERVITPKGPPFSSTAPISAAPARGKRLPAASPLLDTPCGWSQPTHRLPCLASFTQHPVSGFIPVVA